MPAMGYDKYIKYLKDEGIKDYVKERLPYEVERDAWKGSIWELVQQDPGLGPLEDDDQRVILTHIVPTGKQFKLLFLRVWTQDTSGTKFKIQQTNPTATGQTGSVEAYPVLGSVPEGILDYPYIEAAGAEVLGPVPLESPIHVLEGSVDFLVQIERAAEMTGGSKISVSYWGFELP